MTMEPKLDKVSTLSHEDDNVSSAEGKLETLSDMDGIRRRLMPESLQGLPYDELEALNKKLVRKIDFFILPVIGILYILNYIDRQKLSAAKLQGITEDLHMTTQQFATVVSILFVGYLPFQIPSNLIISKISRPGMYICIAVSIWGAISAATASVRTYGQLLAVRAVLGVAEAVFFPGAIYYLSAWYTKRELGKRIAGLYIAQQVGNAFGELFAAGIMQLDGTHGICGWQWLFIIEVVPPLALALFVPASRPNSHKIAACSHPYNATSLSGALNLKPEPLKPSNGATLSGLCFKPYQTQNLLMIFCNMLSQAQGSIANYCPTLVKSLNYSSTISLLLTAPPYILAGIVYYGIMYHSGRRNTCYPLVVGCISVAIIMYIIPMATTNVGARYFSMMILPFASVGPQLSLYKTINVHLARPISKRAVASALVNAIGGTSNIWASYLYYQAPHFYTASGTLMGCAFMFVATITFYRWLVLRENRRLDSADLDQIEKVMKGGVTEEMVQLS